MLTLSMICAAARTAAFLFACSIDFCRIACYNCMLPCFKEAKEDFAKIVSLLKQ